MVIIDELTEKNLILFAAQNYRKPNFSDIEEFYEDLKRFKYIKRLFRKYKSTGELKTRLIINHIIVLQNVFGMDAACTLLFYKIERNFWALLKTFLVYLNSIQEDEMPSVKINKSILTNLGKL